MFTTAVSSTPPRLWPGALKNSGIPATSPAVSGIAARRDFPAWKATPWSAADQHDRLVPQSHAVEPVHHLAHEAGP